MNRHRVQQSWSFRISFLLDTYQIKIVNPALPVKKKKKSSTGGYTNVPHIPQKINRSAMVLSHRLNTTRLWLNYGPFSK